MLDAAADPGAAGEISRNGADIKVYSGGAIRSLSDIGSGLSNVVEDTTPQLGGNLDCQNNAVNNVGNSSSELASRSWTVAGVITAFNIQSYRNVGPEPQLHFQGSINASIGSHTAVTSGQALGRITFDGSDGDSFESGVQILAAANQNFSSTARGSRLEFYTVDNSTTTLDLRWTIEHNGVLTCDSGSLDMNSNGINNIGAAGSDWTQNALTLAGGTAAQLMTIETTGSGAAAGLDLKIPASGTGDPEIRWVQGSGDGSANNASYQFAYASSTQSTRFW